MRVAPVAVMCIGVLGLAAAIAPARADVSPETRASALAAITDTADKICGSVPTSGDRDDIKIKGDVTAKLNGLVKRLADLGISSAADVSSKSYEGVLQADLLEARKDTLNCRMKVFDILQQKILANEIHDDGMLEVLGANVDSKSLTAGMPFVIDVGIMNLGGEPQEVVERSFEIVIGLDQWRDGSAKGIISSVSDRCKTYGFDDLNDPIRIAYPKVPFCPTSVREKRSMSRPILRLDMLYLSMLDA